MTGEGTQKPGPAGLRPADQHSRRGRPGAAEKNIWRNNGWKHLTFDEIHEYKYPRSSMNSNQDELKRGPRMDVIVQLSKDKDQGWILILNKSIS